MNKITAAAVQFCHKANDKLYNLSVIDTFCRKAAAEQVDIIIFPEMCITGYWHVRNLSKAEIVALSEPVPNGPSTTILRNLAVELKMTIGAGLVEQDDSGNLFNTYIAAMPDGTYASHRKLHCFISEHMLSGSSYTVFDTPYDVRMGILICYDNNIVENARMTALHGAEVLLAPHQTGGCDSVSPKCMGLIDPRLWHDRHADPGAIEAEFLGMKGRGWLMRWLPSRAHDNGMFLIFSNGVGEDDGEVRTGNAMILDPYRDILTETWAARDEMVISELDPSLLQNCTGQRWMQSRRPELYTPIAVPTGKERTTRTVRFDLE